MVGQLGAGPAGGGGQDGRDGEHGSAWHQLVLRDGVFPSSSTATNDFTSAFGRAPVLDDILTYLNADQTVSSIKRYNGSTWVAPGAIFPGDILVKGTVSGDRFTAGTEITSPIIKAGLLEGSAIKYNSGQMTTIGNKLAPFIVKGFAQQWTVGASNKTIYPSALMGPGYTSGNERSDGYHQHRVVHYLSDVYLKIDVTKPAGNNNGFYLYVDVRYQMENTSHSQHNVWETIKQLYVDTNTDNASVHLMYLYTTRDEAWEQLEIRIRANSTASGGQPISLRADYEVLNNVASSYAAHSITIEDYTQPIDTTPPPTGDPYTPPELIGDDTQTP